MSDQKSLFLLLLAAFVSAVTSRDALAADQTPRERSEILAPFRLPERITTLEGKTYEKVILDKVEPDGLLVSFSPVEGGSGTAKLKFRKLPAELRERYGYDAERAADHEAAQVRGEAGWRAEYTVWMEQRELAQSEQAARDREMRAAAELRRAEAEQARVEAARYAQDQPAVYYPWWSSGWYDSGSCRGGKRFNNHAPCPKPVVSGIRSSPISPFMGPMRPSGK
jgi:hypothetical protein